MKFQATLLFLLLLPLQTWADHAVTVVSAQGEPLPGAVVTLEPLDHEPDAQPAAGVMDQIDRQFSPYILVVQRGAAVTFPNSDSIKHHVFSFSAAKTFELRLYDQQSPEPLLFDRAGEVELGCNVHDWMLGYIYVADTPYFARTDASGRATLAAPEGRYRIGVWHPRIQDAGTDLEQVLAGERIEAQITLSQPLLPPYEPLSGGGFDDYE